MEKFENGEKRLILCIQNIFAGEIYSNFYGNNEIQDLFLKIKNKDLILYDIT